VGRNDCGQGQCAGGTVRRIRELDQIGISGLDHVNHDAALAAPEAMLSKAPGKPNALEALVPMGRLPPSLGKCYASLRRSLSEGGERPDTAIDGRACIASAGSAGGQ